MNNPVSTTLPEADLPEETDARWDRTTGMTAAVVQLEGKLKAIEPLHIGGTQEEEKETKSDLPLLKDPVSGRPLLPGTTLAGALRAYLDTREHGFPDTGRQDKHMQQDESLAAALFGERAGEEEGASPAPSTVIVDDALGRMPEEASVEVYEGNRLAGASRTAEKEALYSRTAWPAGTTFDLHFEMKLPVGEERAARYCTALVSALRGLESDERAGIRLGGRKRRGFGRVGAQSWQVRCFDLTDPEDFLCWVENGNESLSDNESPGCIESRSCGDVAELCGVLGQELRDVLGREFEDVTIIPDDRTLLFVETTCILPHGVLDRTGGSAEEPDVTHRRAYDATAGEDHPVDRPVLTGTQMGGALRARATRIAQTFAPGEEDARQLVEAVFGSDPDREDDLRAGRLWIDRSFIRGDSDPVGLMDLVQNRIQIVPWTQAPAKGALFNEQPVRGGDDVEVTLRWRLDQPAPEEISLMLHLLRDLWTRDLATAGTQSIGRGRFSGNCATVEVQEGPDAHQCWTFEARGSGSDLHFTDGSPKDLNRYADDLLAYFDDADD